MARSSRISIIICTYDRADYLRDTLQSLLKNKADPDRYELLIIDNNSSDNTPAVAHQFIDSFPDHNIRYIKESQQGLSFARNRGIREAKNPILLFLDDDILTGSQFIRHWLIFFDQHADAKCAGGRIEVQFDDPRPSWMSHFLLPLLGYHNLGSTVKTYGQRKYPFGGNMAFRQSIFDEYGFFNTDLGRKGEELKASEEKEFFRRLKNDNIEIYYLPDAKLDHRVDNERLTPDYIKRQAVGLGQSIALQLRQKTLASKIAKGSSELFKLIVSLGLFLPYTFTLQWSKAVMLIKFRKWILEGYLSVSQ
ncbi:Glycosyltransferase involved in cell wall bisynthesis [Fodinibius salinus]|uniref:Glycosyltransferase involved in cell wall bisynthesis n=1 Tax=Fodinibius salinus TaxID=860790 RepID=A0A5D3YJA8_9BACT|nr:glycosyltransferase [Fodinibius salinus]TYP91727.1 Glycosyltransferase involved in cell wall bisynthesis [Fodinibius salinus]